MNAKKRVLKAINQQQPDRVPLDYGARPEIRDQLYHHFGVADDEALREKLHVDIRRVNPTYAGPELRHFPDGTWEDIWGTRYRVQTFATGSYDEDCYHPLGDVTSLRELDKYRWPRAEWYDFSSVKADCERNQQYAVFAGGNAVFYIYCMIRGFDKALTDLVDEPDLVHAAIARITDFCVDYLDRLLRAAEGGIDVVTLGDDFGTQEGLLVSPAMFRDYFAPAFRQLVAVMKQHRAKAFLHSCGSVVDLIPDFIAVGIDVLNPIQTRARGMVPEVLKARFGRELCFHGAMDVQHTLPFGTTEEVAREVQHRIDVLGAGGGYILAPSHSIQADTPLENVLTMYQTALEYGQY